LFGQKQKVRKGDKKGISPFGTFGMVTVGILGFFAGGYWCSGVFWLEAKGDEK
jgi:hypothetical protein